ncbi:transketolase [Phaeacidiphilus oryzae]|uniref:transketolase n=1 Tax=Phaeacidiphilus oryzae TaxID=348818 RepID=UPI000A032E75|nr:transketolase [Phaeacidiphilus oryzae]
MDTTPTSALLVEERSDLGEVAELARRLRVDSLRSSTAAGSGHPTSSLSAADLLAVLTARHLRFDWSRPDLPENDRLIFSKGHATPLLYSVFAAAGVVGEEELLTGYRRHGSRLQGHPTPVLPWVDAATGSLGQGIAYGAGMALAIRRLQRSPARVWVLCGDSEMAEGSVWEALDLAGRERLGGFVAIVDVNRLGQRGPTALGWDLDAYAARARAFGCRALTVDGHDLAAVDEALSTAGDGREPTVVIARTVKGQGVAELADQEDWHGKPLTEDRCAQAVEELGGVREVTVRGPLPPEPTPSPVPPTTPTPARATESGGPAEAAGSGGSGEVKLPVFEPGESVSTRSAFGKALAALGSRPDVVVLDAEVGNSTHAQDFAEAHPDRYFELYIAEQQMVATAVGMAARGYRPYAATFAAFLSRAHDFLRMAAVSQADIALCGSHVGVEIGADGPSQMGLEDLAMMRALHGSTVLYPADATAAAALTAEMADLPGISYLRTTRGGYPVLYPDGERFPVCGSKTLRRTDADRVTLVGAGVTVHECLSAADELARHGIPARVIDLYSVKPVDAETLECAAEETGALVVVEDHRPEGGLGEAVLSALAERRLSPAVAHLAVRVLPDSGGTAELLDFAGISAAHITAAARDLIWSETDAGADAQTDAGAGAKGARTSAG